MTVATTSQARPRAWPGRRRIHWRLRSHLHHVIRQQPIRTWKDQSMVLPTWGDFRLQILGSRTWFVELSIRPACCARDEVQTFWMQVPGRDIFSSSSLPDLSSDKDANIVNVLATLCGCSQVIGPICVGIAVSLLVGASLLYYQGIWLMSQRPLSADKQVFRLCCLFRGDPWCRGMFLTKGIMALPDYLTGRPWKPFVVFQGLTVYMGGKANNSSQ